MAFHPARAIVSGRRTSPIPNQQDRAPMLQRLAPALLALTALEVRPSPIRP
jgi:hypothetical protein